MSFIIEDYDDALTTKEYRSLKGNILLGLCCINNSLRGKNNKGIFCSRTCTRATFSVEKAMELATQNVKDIIPLIKWNVDHNIHHLRLSSDIFPHYTDEETEPYTMDFCKGYLKEAGDYANSVNHRITMHPCQINNVGAKERRVFDITEADLSMHADVLDLMNIDDNGILCVHGGGTYGDKEATMRRWIEQFDDLPTKVKRRLCIENCEKSYSVRDCLTIAKECKIPVIYDNHHYNCYSILHPNEKQERIEDMMDEVIESWGSRIPLFHISEQAEDKKIGAHSDYITHIPRHMLTVPYKYKCKLSIEVEAKAKEAAILPLIERYDL
jgi:UV DNA damage endonuclease